MIKKIIAGLMSLLMGTFLAGCHNQKTSDPGSPSGEPVNSNEVNSKSTTTVADTDTTTEIITETTSSEAAASASPEKTTSTQSTASATSEKPTIAEQMTKNETIAGSTVSTAQTTTKPETTTQPAIEEPTEYGQVIPSTENLETLAETTNAGDVYLNPGNHDEFDLE